MVSLLPFLLAQEILTTEGIDGYVKQQSKYAERYLPRVYGDAAKYDAKKPNWRQYKDVKALEKARKENLYEVALVYPQQFSPERVDLSLSSPSGDWAQSNTYIFWSDKLVKLDSTHNTFYGNVSVHRNIWFSALTGQVIRKMIVYRDLESGKKLSKAPGDFFNLQPPLYMTPAQLPFAHLLKRR